MKNFIIYTKGYNEQNIDLNNEEKFIEIVMKNSKEEKKIKIKLNNSEKPFPVIRDEYIEITITSAKDYYMESNEEVDFNFNDSNASIVELSDREEFLKILQEENKNDDQ